MATRTLSALLREPLIQFLILGGMLFAIDRYLAGDAEGPRRILVDDERRADVVATFRDQRGRYPDPEELDQAITRWTREEILYREARALGLDQGDAMIRQRLVEKLRRLLLDGVNVGTPTEAELRAFFEAWRDRYDRPALYDFEQFLVPAETDADADADAGPKALDLAQELGIGPPPAAYRHLVRRYLRRPAGNIETTFGEDQGRRLLASPDFAWIALSSERGWHLARVTRRFAAERADFAALRDRVAADWRDAAARDGLAAAVAKIADRYRVEVRPQAAAADLDAEAQGERGAAQALPGAPVPGAPMPGSPAPGDKAPGPSSEPEGVARR